MWCRIGELAEEGGPSLPEDQVRAYAANLTVVEQLAVRYGDTPVTVFVAEAP